MNASECFKVKQRFIEQQFERPLFHLPAKCALPARWSLSIKLDALRQLFSQYVLIMQRAWVEVEWVYYKLA